MTVEAQRILEAARLLPEAERATLADEILASLDRTDPDLDSIWAGEAERRIEAFEAWRIHAISAEEVFTEDAK